MINRYDISIHSVSRDTVEDGQWCKWEDVEKLMKKSNEHRLFSKALAKSMIDQEQEIEELRRAIKCQ